MRYEIWIQSDYQGIITGAKNQNMKVVVVEQDTYVMYSIRLVTYYCCTRGSIYI